MKKGKIEPNARQRIHLNFPLVYLKIDFLKEIFCKIYFVRLVFFYIRQRWGKSVTREELWMHHLSSIKQNWPINILKATLQVNGILLPKLFWPTVRKNCSSDWEKLLKFEAEGREFSKILRSLEQFIQTVKGQNNSW